MGSITGLDRTWSSFRMFDNPNSAIVVTQKALLNGKSAEDLINEGEQLGKVEVLSDGFFVQNICGRVGDEVYRALNKLPADQRNVENIKGIVDRFKV